MRSISYLFIIIALFSIAAFTCPGKTQMLLQQKIQFDYAAIDTKGLRNGEVAVDYEFCIRANEELLKEVMAIDTSVRVMKTSKGRIGCTSQQWLIINSTHSKGWKEKLYAIARLEYVERILETHYE